MSLKKYNYHNHDHQIMYVFQVGSVGICHDILVNFWGYGYKKYNQSSWSVNLSARRKSYENFQNDH